MTFHCHFTVMAQIDAKLLDYNNKLEINLQKDSSSDPIRSWVHSVNVIDVRDDTAAVGFYSVTRFEAVKYGVKKGSSGNKGDRDLWSKVYHCSPSLKDGITRWLSEYLKFRSDDTLKNNLLIVVKKLWLSFQADKPRVESVEARSLVSEWDAGVLCKMEFYLERDSIFYPLYRIDSVFTFSDPLYDYNGVRFVNNADMFLTSVLKSSMSRLTDIRPDDIIAKRRKLAFTEIYGEYSRKSATQILHEEKLVPGVYTTYEEFRTNAPSIKEYQLREGDMGDILYVKEGKEEYPTRNAWGYCDGKNIFINSGDKYSKLVRNGNTFYFYGMRGLARKSKIVFMKSSGLGYATNSGPKKSVYKKELRYLQIDMETGEAY